ncbi:hypothetical protein V5799_019402 [Amblyomma americanum]|uniref:Peptidase M13 C-terminal domain-containing protein n=1 Tax=Amblyomma americanum TaxID=6943 RepID=A0AAQ4EWW3_AMBAM
MATGPGRYAGSLRTSGGRRKRSGRADAEEVAPEGGLPDFTEQTSCSVLDSSGPDSGPWHHTVIVGTLTHSVAGGTEPPMGKTYSVGVSSDIANKTYTVAHDVGDSTYTLAKAPPAAPSSRETSSGTQDSTFVYTSETTNTYTVTSSPRRHPEPTERRHRSPRHRSRSGDRRHQWATGGPLLLTRRQLLCYPLAVSATLGALATILAVAPLQRAAAGREDGSVLRPPRFGGLLFEQRPIATSKRCSSAPCRRDAAYLNRQLSTREASPCGDFERYACLRWRPRSAGARSADQDEVLQLEQQAFLWLRSRKPLGPLLDKCMRDRQDGDEQLGSFLLPSASLDGFPYSGSRAGSVAIWRAAGRVLMHSGCAALLSVLVKADGSVALGLPDTLSDGSMDAAETAYRALANSVKGLSGAKVEGAVRFALRVERAAYYGASSTSAKIVASQLGELWAFVSQVRRGLPSGATVTILSPSYMRRLRDIVNRSPPDAVLNYLALRLHFRAAPLTPPGPLLEAYSRHTGRHERWRQCFGVVLDFAPTLALEAARSVTGASFVTEQAAELANAVRHEVLELMSETPLLSEATAHQEALRKARLQVFGPPWSQNPRAVRSFEESLPRLRAGQAALRSWAAIATHELESRLTRESWPAPWALKRTCVLDAASGRLALPPLLLNESTPGGIVGALQFSRAGARLATCLLQSLLALEPTALPSLPPTASAHVRRARSCLDAQKLGNNNAREVLSAWAGLRPALQIFKQREGNGLSLEGLPQLNGVQLFFVYWALDQCSAASGRSVSPNRNTVINAAVANEPAFHEAFLCTPQSPMNPLPHCDLWSAGGVVRA